MNALITVALIGVLVSGLASPPFLVGTALLLVLVLVNYRLRQPAHATRQTEPASISNTTGQLELPRA